MSRHLLARRDPEALRKLKDDVAAVREDPEVAAAFHEHDYGAPGLTVPALRAGVHIDSFPCRLTVGTYALLRSSEARILGLGDDKSPLRPYDVALGVFLLCDDRRNEALSVVGDLELLERSVTRFSHSLNMNKASDQLLEFLRRASDAMFPEEEREQGPVDDLEPFHAPEDSWADDVDLFGHEYSWSAEYVLWELPLVRAAILKDSIAARKKGHARQPRRASTAIKLLQLIERKRSEQLCA